MKKTLLFLSMLLILTNCINPEDRSWIIPLTIDDSMLAYTPEQKEGFQKRRATTLDSMEHGYLILKSSDQWSQNRHEFRSNNNFYYLTGYATSGSYLILVKQDAEQVFLSKPYTNLRMEIYDGGQPSSGEILDQYGVDNVLSFNEVRMMLADILSSGSPVYVDMKNRDLMDDLEKLPEDLSQIDIRDAATILDEMRVFKESTEVARMQKACNITARSLTKVMNQCKPGMYEYEMEAVIEGTFLEYGSHMPGFPSIVGSGPNSTTLHYEPNTRIMEDGDLLLMDIGADYGYYSADISRTIPVNGKFSTEQQTIYQLVLDAQKAAIEQMIPGNGVRDGHHAGRKVMNEGLAKLGLITDPDAEWQIQFYCIHGSSHYLGMDVHDVGDYEINPRLTEEDSTGRSKFGRILEPGMVLTIEPGIYIRENGLDQAFEMFAHNADSSEIASFVDSVRPLYEQYTNTGVRIEDDILITNDGNLVLSRYAPKEVEDIEQLMR
ncbi:MAG: aminopeptidase P N-terminal domain-containing protein [Bacteroides sp.]|nr:aminopeptidase P N-terminal domain-containing protein [Bacteroides sp.]